MPHFQLDLPVSSSIVAAAMSDSFASAARLINYLAAWDSGSVGSSGVRLETRNVLTKTPDKGRQGRTDVEPVKGGEHRRDQRDDFIEPHSVSAFPTGMRKKGIMLLRLRHLATVLGLIPWRLARTLRLT